MNKRWPNNASRPVSAGASPVGASELVGAQEIAELIRRIDSSGGVADQIAGTALMGRNRYDEAISAFQSAYNAAPDAPQPMDSLVGALLKANRKDQATAFLKSVLSKNPNNANALVLLGSTQLSSGLADQALKTFLPPSRRN